MEMITMFKSKYIDCLREYYYVGGMPEVVQSFVLQKDYNKVREIQKNLLNYYQQDFSKHAEILLAPRLNLVWNSIPMQLAKENKKYIYGQVREEAGAKDFELAPQLVAGLGVMPYYYSTANSTGKIDFLLQAKQSIVPFEVKAEENLRAESLRAFCDKYHPAYAVRISMSDYRKQEWMTNIPLYNIEWIGEYL